MQVSTQQEFIQQVEEMESYLHSFVETGSDQELFIASYLHGHFDLAVAAVEKQAYDEVQDALNRLKSVLSSQLQHAFEKQELTSDDQAQVLAVVEQLLPSD